jgi:pimeloyl-ACP methyl ester carboxylesterase
VTFVAVTTPLQPPSFERAVLEPLSLFELSTFHAASPLFPFVARGNGHPVLVIPGLVGSDHSTLPLRQLLSLRGHDAHGWLLGRNYGAHERVMGGMYDRLEQLYGGSGQTVSLVGWSLGGIFARELARDRPSMVRQVITLCAPFRFRDGDRGNASAVYDLVGPRVEPFVGRTSPEHERPPMPVPVTAVYTRTDGIVPWQACIETAGGRRENVEVRSTHTGMGVNMLATIVVADRLAQPEGRWRRFRPPLMLRAWYPRSSAWRPTVS